MSQNFSQYQGQQRHFISVSQLSVAKSKKLESAYGVHLIEKNGQGIQLTALGIQLYEIIRSFFENAIVSAESLLKKFFYSPDFRKFFNDKFCDSSNFRA